MDDKREQISGIILDYLRNNPDAGDTLEGIAGWWVGLQQIEISVKDVANALDGLLEEGVIRTHTARDGTSIYRINSP
ncbi:MAG: hypothetical protein ACYSWO_15290 [Planctomycetota bacterium]|jgi:Fe2+ or Zn2+ uptake regulation protein